MLSQALSLLKSYQNLSATQPHSDKKSLLLEARSLISPQTFYEEAPLMSLQMIVNESKNKGSCFFDLAQHKSYSLYAPHSFQIILAYTAILNEYQRHGIPFLQKLFHNNFQLDFDFLKEVMFSQLDVHDHTLIASLDKRSLENAIFINGHYDIFFKNKDGEIFFTANPESYFAIGMGEIQRDTGYVLVQDSAEIEKRISYDNYLHMLKKISKMNTPDQVYTTKAGQALLSFFAPFDLTPADLKDYEKKEFIHLGYSPDDLMENKSHQGKTVYEESCFFSGQYFYTQTQYGKYYDRRVRLPQEDYESLDYKSRALLEEIRGVIYILKAIAKEKLSSAINNASTLEAEAKAFDTGKMKNRELAALRGNPRLWTCVFRFVVERRMLVASLNSHDFSDIVPTESEIDRINKLLAVYHSSL